MLRELRNYVVDSSFSIHYTKDGLNIINYTSILAMEDTRISLTYISGTLVVTGRNLVVKKLMEEEILIVGHISSIEFR